MVHVHFHIDSIYNNQPRCPFIGKFYKTRLKPLAVLNVCNKLLDCASKAIVNSSASHNFTTEHFNDGKHQAVQNSIQLCVANHDIITSTATDEFPLENVLSKARVCHKFPHLANNLLSVGQMCDLNMLVLFDANYVYIFNQTGNKVLCGQRHPLTKLYMIPLLRDVTNAKLQRVLLEINLVERVPNVTGSINNAYKIKSITSLINYLHRVVISVPIL